MLRMAQNPMKTEKPKVAPYWSVIFETKDGGFHPIRYGEADGPNILYARIRQMAYDCLTDNMHWLKRIESIRALTTTPKGAR